MPYIRLLRPHQWVKNIFVFAGLIFGKKIGDPGSVIAALQGFALLCVISSSVYVMNDIRDREEDRLHPRKKDRPVASGAVSVPLAGGLALFLLALGMTGSYALDRGFFVCMVAYFVLQIAYTLALKHMVILDVVVLGVGFVLRAVAGAVLVHVAISHWLVLCTFTLCLFMGFSKRRCEFNALAETANSASSHRRTLRDYTPQLLDHMTTLTAGIAMTCFMLYTTDRRTIEEFRTNYLVYTTPIVVYAVLRYALLVEQGRVDGPTEIVLRDRPFQIAVLLWAALAGAIIYYGHDAGYLLYEWFGPPR
jgi:4-hydroxybenzoate polyprenyltransferase